MQLFVVLCGTACVDGLVSRRSTSFPSYPPLPECVSFVEAQLEHCTLSTIDQLAIARPVIPFRLLPLPSFTRIAFNSTKFTANMFKNTFQSGFLSILYSIGSNPLQIWDKKVKNGSIKRVTDNEIQSFVIEITGANVSTTFVTCPPQPRASLGIKLPYLVLIVKNQKKYFSFEVEILDDKGIRRRFRASNFQSVTRVKHFICTMPLRLDEGWNQIGFNLMDFTKRAYGSNYVETVRVTVNANCRLRRIYFADRMYSEDELPAEFKLYLPVSNSSTAINSASTSQ